MKGVKGGGGGVGEENRSSVPTILSVVVVPGPFPLENGRGGRAIAIF